MTADGRSEDRPIVRMLREPTNSRPIEYRRPASDEPFVVEAYGLPPACFLGRCRGHELHVADIHQRPGQLNPGIAVPHPHGATNVLRIALAALSGRCAPAAAEDQS